MTGRRAEAIEHFRVSVRLDPGYWRAYFGLGGLLGQEGNYAEAKAASGAAIRLNPAFPISYLNLGLAFTKLGDLHGAQHQFEETLRLDPGNARAADCLAQVKAALAAKEAGHLAPAVDFSHDRAP